MLNRLRVGFLLLSLAGCAVPNGAQAQVYIYRGVAANAVTGRAELGNTAFNFTGVAPDLTLSTMNATSVAFPCFFQFTVNGVANNPPQQGDTGTLAAPAVPNPPGGAFNVVFDNNPAGHWSIQLPAGVTNTDARAAISTYARGPARAANVVNGSLANCN